MKRLLILLNLAVFFTACKSSKTHYSYHSDLKEFDLKGPVKKIKSYTQDFNRKNLSEDSVFYYSSYYDARVFNHLNAYYEFNKQGMKIRKVRIDSFTHVVPSDTSIASARRTYSYRYNKKMFNKKLKIKQDKQFPRFVYNPYHVKIDREGYSPYKVLIEKKNSLKKIKKIFEYEIKNENLIKELCYSLWDKEPDGIIEDKDLKYSVNYKYNNKGQLTRKEFIIDSINNRSTLLINTPLDQFEVSKYSSPVEKFTYDERGNLVSVYFIEDEEKNLFRFGEEYTYNDKNELTKLRRINPNLFVAGFNKHIKHVYDMYFNDKGDIIKAESIENDAETVYATFLFDYGGYDQYDNWTLCKGYLLGKITKNPHITINRKFEYYKN